MSKADQYAGMRFRGTKLTQDAVWTYTVVGHPIEAVKLPAYWEGCTNLRIGDIIFASTITGVGAEDSVIDTVILRVTSLYPLVVEELNGQQDRNYQRGPRKARGEPDNQPE
jgi:isopentenyldiphosphate isomerase